MDARDEPGGTTARITHAIVRPPAESFAAGITSSGLGPPDYGLALAQHEAYCRGLEGLGVALTRLPAEPDFPDSTFVEDAAIVSEGRALLTRPGASSRAGEVASMRAALAPLFPELEQIAAPGTLDGGDVCEAGLHVFIGVSERTNALGAARLATWFERQGRRSTVLDIRRLTGLLHLKTGISWLGGRRLLAVGAIAGHEALDGWEIVPVPQGEEYAANCIVVNGATLVASGFPATAERLTAMGHRVVPVQMSEYRKMDGGLSCLSIRW